MRAAGNKTELTIKIVDKGRWREVFVDGPHWASVRVNGPGHYKTELSMRYLKLLRDLASKEWLVREMLRATDSSTVEQPVLGLLDYSGGIPDAKILDFGCGSGAAMKAILLAARGKSTLVYGADINPDMVRLARQLLRDYQLENRSKLFVLGNSKELPFENEELDLVLLNAVYEHLLTDERVRLCREFQRVLKPGGRLCLRGTPNRLWPVEFHTSGLSLIPYLPTRIAYQVARRFSRGIARNASLEYCLRQGLIGATWWEIKRNLPNMVYTPSMEVHRLFRLGRRTRKKKALLLPALALECFICRPLGIPLSAFAKHLDLVMIKKL